MARKITLGWAFAGPFLCGCLLSPPGDPPGDDGGGGSEGVILFGFTDLTTSTGTPAGLVSSDVSDLGDLESTQNFSTGAKTTIGTDSGGQTSESIGTQSESTSTVSSSVGTTGDMVGDSGDLDSDSVDLDSGGVGCTIIQWPDCRVWHDVERDFYYGPNCNRAQVLLPSVRSGMLQGQLVCDKIQNGPGKPWGLKSVWRIVSPYFGDMWREDEDGECQMYQPKELPPTFPHHYYLEGAPLSDEAVSTLPLEGCWK